MKSSSRAGIQPPQLPKPLRAETVATLEDHSELATITVSGSDFTQQTAANVLFEQVRLQRAIFNRTRLPHLRLLDARLEMCDLSGADWEKARFRRVEFNGCRLLGVQWPEAALDDVLFRECNLEGALLALSKFKAARFESCVLRGVSFENADLSNVVFHLCDLSDADLRNSKLQGADLRGSTLNRVQVGAKELHGAIIDRLQAPLVVNLLGLIIKEDDEV